MPYSLKSIFLLTNALLKLNSLQIDYIFLIYTDISNNFKIYTKYFVDIFTLHIRWKQPIQSNGVQWKTETISFVHVHKNFH